MGDDIAYTFFRFIVGNPIRKDLYRVWQEANFDSSQTRKAVGHRWNMPIKQGSRCKYTPGALFLNIEKHPVWNSKKPLAQPGIFSDGHTASETFFVPWLTTKSISCRFFSFSLPNYKAGLQRTSLKSGFVLSKACFPLN